MIERKLPLDVRKARGLVGVRGRSGRSARAYTAGRLIMTAAQARAMSLGDAEARKCEARLSREVAAAHAQKPAGAR